MASWWVLWLIPGLHKPTFNLQFSFYGLLSEATGFMSSLQDCRDTEGLNCTWFESTGMRQCSFLTFFLLPTLFPRTVLSFSSFGKSPSSLHIPESKGPLCITARQTACELFAYRFYPGAIPATLISQKCASTVSRNHEFKELFYINGVDFHTLAQRSV